MFKTLSHLLTSAFSRGDTSLSIPILDGALKPNNLLEEAPVFAEHSGLEDLALGTDGTLYVAAAKQVFRVSRTGQFEPIAAFDRDITAIAVAADHSLAVALGSEVHVAKQKIQHVDQRPLVAVNALHFCLNGDLLISDASATHASANWCHDLMSKGRSGRLLRYNAQTAQTDTVASGLAYSYGILMDEQAQIIVSESWKHQLINLNTRDPQRGAALLNDLPGYPARMAPAVGGGFWLSLFSCRTQLVEFVLSEEAYRREMMQTIDSRHWISPALSSGADFLEPLQSGAVKQMGILKPWAPPRSYGLVVRIGADYVPRYSLHSRVGGRHHGIVAVAQREDELFVLSKGSNRILRLSVKQATQGAML